MSVLVTGATGFLGGRLVELLLDRGAAVTALARPGSDLGHLERLPVRVVHGRLEDPASLQEAVRGVHTVYHCAALCGDWGSWAAFRDSNALGTSHLVEAAVKAGVRRLVHVSSTDVYGYPRVPCAETATPMPCRLPYHRSKLLAERAVAARRDRIETTIVRPATIYGPRSKDVLLMGGLLRRREMLLMDGGETRAGLIFVDDVARAMIEAAASPAAVHKTYNLCHPAPVTWRIYLDALAEVFGAAPCRGTIPSALAYAGGAVLETFHRLLHLPGRPLCTRHAVLLLSRDQGYPCERVLADFGFRPRVGLTEGMGLLDDWLRGVRRGIDAASTVASPASGGTP